MTCFEYLQEAKSLVDELALVGKLVDEQKALIPIVMPFQNQLTGN
jgi:hypothetical protein